MKKTPAELIAGDYVWVGSGWHRVFRVTVSYGAARIHLDGGRVIYARPTTQFPVQTYG